MKRPLIAFLIAGTCLTGTMHASEAPLRPATQGGGSSVEDVIPMTVGNLRGHKMLYEEGWFVVSSSKKAFAFARERSVDSSADAIARAGRAIVKDSTGYARSVTEGVSGAAGSGKELVVKGTRKSGEILVKTGETAASQFAYARESFGRAMESLVQGNLSIVRNTREERNELAALPGDYFGGLREDFSNLHDKTGAVRQRFSGKIDTSWERAFKKASVEFRTEYDRSGESGNSLAALGPVLFGWLKAFYHGAAAPAAKTVVKTGTAGTTYAVFLPVAATTIVAGRTVQAVGLTVYYTGKTGVKILSPTVEGGMLAGLSLLSAGTVPLTYVAGGTYGVLNQVAFSTAGPVYGAAAATGSAVVNTAGYVAFVAYDAAAGAATVVINQAASGVVLGYNALTAVPTHLLLAAGDTAVFLAWDGPRLVIAAASGTVSSGQGAEHPPASLGDLPVGTVVDLKKLEKTSGVKVEVLSTDEAVIRNVLQQLPCDLREDAHGNCTVQ